MQPFPHGMRCNFKYGMCVSYLKRGDQNHANRSNRSLQLVMLGVLNVDIDPGLCLGIIEVPIHVVNCEDTGMTGSPLATRASATETTFTSSGLFPSLVLWRSTEPPFLYEDNFFRNVPCCHIPSTPFVLRPLKNVYPYRTVYFCPNLSRHTYGWRFGLDRHCAVTPIRAAACKNGNDMSSFSTTTHHYPCIFYGGNPPARVQSVQRFLPFFRILHGFYLACCFSQRHLSNKGARHVINSNAFDFRWVSPPIESPGIQDKDTSSLTRCPARVTVRPSSSTILRFNS